MVITPKRKPVSWTSVQHLQLNGACHSSDRDKQVSNSEETIEIRSQVVVILLVLVTTHDTAQDTWVKTNVFPQIIAALKSQKVGDNRPSRESGCTTEDSSNGR